LFSLFYGSQLALRQGELRRVWAYGSLSHMGLILLGLAIASPAGVQAAIFQSLSHGLIPSLLFLLVSFFARWYGTTDIGEMAGLKSAFPVVAFLLYLGGFASPGCRVLPDLSESSPFLWRPLNNLRFWAVLPLFPSF
jgi:NADH-Ubiquinone/plastoquinone (complex I), various chains.